MLEPTLPKAFISNVNKKSNAPFLFYKQGGTWRSVSWREVDEKVKWMTLGLISSLGVSKNDRISPISNTVPDIAYCCLACATSGAIFAPIYHTNSPIECAHVINDSGARVAFAEDDAQLAKLKKVLNDCPNLEKIIVFRNERPDDDSRVMTLDKLIELGKEEFRKNGDGAYYERIQSIRPEDISAIIYTSGTTGAPKGVKFSNAGIIRAQIEHNKIFPMSEGSKGISFLPMAHALELMDGHWRHVVHGFPQVYAQSIQTVYEDVQETKPTFFFQTPRFYEKVYTALAADIEASPAWKKKMINLCLAIGSRYQDIKYRPDKAVQSVVAGFLNSIAHRIFFRKVHATVGGRAEWGGCGGSPVPPRTLRFFVACNFPIYEGYGLTESQGVVSQNRPGAVKVGTIGKPMAGLEVKIADDGEILVKGWARCGGYWNNPEANRELFEGGWLHTGDIGSFDKDGYLSITGRKKEILITSTGKNISPSIVQNALQSSPYIHEAVVFGEGQKYLTALLTLDEGNIKEYARQKNLKYDDFAALSQHRAVRELIEKEIELKNNELGKIEQIRNFTILQDQFRQDRGELTPTMKLKRRVIEERYRQAIDSMYTK